MSSEDERSAREIVKLLAKDTDNDTAKDNDTDSSVEFYAREEVYDDGDID